MFAEETNDAIKQIVNKIESVGFLSQQESMVDAIKPYTTEQQDHMNTIEIEDNLLNFLQKSVIPEKQEQHEKLNGLVEKTLNKLEKLNIKKAAIQARIELLEKHLKQDGSGQTNQNNLVQKLEEKRNCMTAWRLLTGVNFDFSNQNVSGYCFNKKNARYATFEIPKEGDYPGKLWSLVNKNANEDA